MKHFFSFILILALGVSMGYFFFSLYKGNWFVPLIVFIAFLVASLIFEVKNAVNAPEE